MQSVEKFRRTALASAASICLLGLGVGLAGCGKSQDPAALVAEAKQYQAKGDYKAAVIQLKNALQKSPEDRDARFLLGTLYVDTADGLSAEKELRKAASLGMPRDAVAPLLARALLMTGQPQRALDETAPATGAADTPVILDLRGTAFLELNKLDDARSAFTKVLAARPDDADALIGMAKLADAANDAAGATRLVSQAVAKNPSNPEVWLAQGDLARSRGDHAQAVQAYDQAIKLQPASERGLVSRASALILLGKYPEAKADLDSARKLTPNNLKLLYTQAQLEYAQGNNKAALDDLQLILRVAPESLPTVLLTGAVQFALGANEQAEQQVKKYLAAIPDNLYARKLLASIYLKGNQPAKAIDVLTPALKAGTQDAQLLMVAGNAFLQNKEFGKATDYFEKAKALAPKNPLVHTALGMSRLGEGDSNKAVAELELAASLDDKTPKAAELLVTTQMRLKQFDKALVSVKSLEKQKPNDPGVQNLKGGVYLGLGDLAMARTSFEKALQLSPTFYPAADNLARIDMQEQHPERAKARFETMLKADKRNIQAMNALAGIALSKGDTAEATRWLEKAVAENPDALAPALTLGLQNLKAGAKEKALTSAQKLFAANDANPDVIDFLGQSQAANGDLPGALATFRKLAALKPEMALPQMRIATVQSTMRDVPGALESLKKAVAIQPDYLDAQVGLLSMQAKNGDLDAAMKTAQQIQTQRPKQAVGFALEGDLLMAQKKPLLAQKSFERAQSVEKSGLIAVKLHEAGIASGKEKEADARLLQWLAQNPADVATRIYLGSSYQARHQIPAAIAQYESVLTTQPQNVVVLNNLAYAYLEAKDPRALETGEKALTLAPSSPVIMDTVGWILVQKGNDARGLGLLQTASKQLPANEEIRFHLATALVKAGDKTNARKELEQLTASKTFIRVEEAKRLLQTL